MYLPSECVPTVNPEDRKDADRRAAALHAIAVERAKIDLRELELLSPPKVADVSDDTSAGTGKNRSAEAELAAERWPAKQARKKRNRDREK